MSSVSKNLEFITQKLHANTRLLAVSKTHPIGKIVEAYQWGQRDFGENKVQDLLQKSQALASYTDLRWHFIGHLQSNKINQLMKVHNLVSIHSLDSYELLEKVLKKKSTQKIGIFLQINTSDEVEKSGFAVPDDFSRAIKLLKSSENFYLQGLMTIGKIRTDDFIASAHQCFSELQHLQQKLAAKYDLQLELSMGMSRDFKIAEEYETTWVRIGTDIFGERE